jgi:hypothetical protein
MKRVRRREESEGRQKKTDNKEEKEEGGKGMCSRKETHGMVLLFVLHLAGYM